MTYLYRVEETKGEVTRSAQIELIDEQLDLHFYENTSYIGTIEYPNKTYAYVVDAADNWINWIMTKETINEYKR